MSEKYNNKIIDTIIENVDDIEIDEKKEIIQKIVSLEIKQKKIQKKIKKLYEKIQKKD